ncbi:MAG TPA: hypothetical protein VMM78_06415 [Thermomicrobiales bacterium]|nr:hypothetical protein [Thermomicrobiales bacterium]
MVLGLPSLAAEAAPKPNAERTATNKCEKANGTLPWWCRTVPSEEEPAPDDGDPAPDDGDAAPDDGDPALGDGDPAPDDGDAAPDDGDAALGDGDAALGDGSEPSDVFVVPATIDSTGTRDVTAQLSEFLAAVPDGATVSFLRDGHYRVEGTLKLHGRHGLTLEGNGATIRATTTGHSHRAHWQIVGGSDLVMRNMTIIGPHNGGYVDELQYQHAVDLRGVSGVHVSRVSVQGVYGDCVYIGLGLDSRLSWSERIRVTESVCQDNGRQGIAIVAGRDVVIGANRLTRIGLMPFDIEPNGVGDGADGVTIIGNMVGTSRQWFFGIVGEAPVRNVTVAGNSLVGRSMSILLQLEGTQRISNVTIRDNVSDQGQWYNGDGSVISAHRVDGLTVTGNHQPAAGSTQVFVSATSSCRVLVSGNTFPGGGDVLRSLSPSC